MSVKRTGLQDVPKSFASIWNFVCSTLEIITIALTEAAGGFGDLFQLTKLPALPEPFVWKVFNDLAIALLLLERGNVDPNGVTSNTIIHRDIKLANGEDNPFDTAAVERYTDWHSVPWHTRGQLL